MILGQTYYSPAAVTRDRRALMDGRCNYILSIHDADYEVEMDGKTHTIPSGQIVILDESNPFAFRLPGTWGTVLSLERRQMERLAPTIAGRSLHIIPAASSDAALLAGYLALLNRHPPTTNVDPIADHVHHLVARLLTIGQMREPTGRAAIGAARLRLVKADIARHLFDPGLDIGDVARRQQVSPRYIQQLFAREGTTFSDHVRGARLDAALKRLADPRQVGQPISHIAFEAGFGDLSTFNRAFRKRFGRTPRDVRAEVLAIGR